MKRIFYLLIVTLALLFSLNSWAQVEGYQINIINKFPPQNGANPAYMVNPAEFIPAISSVYNPAPASTTNVNYGQTLSFSYTGGSLKQKTFASPALNPTFSYALCIADSSSGNLPQGLCETGYQQIDLCTVSYSVTYNNDGWTCGAQILNGTYCHVNAGLLGNLCLVQVTFTPS